MTHNLCSSLICLMDSFTVSVMLSQGVVDASAAPFPEAGWSLQIATVLLDVSSEADKVGQPEC